MLVRPLYTLLVAFIAPFALLRWWWRGRRMPAYRAHLAERFGYALPQGPFDVWIHAVSVGETRAAIPLIQAWYKAHPDARILLTHSTPTGRTTGRELFKDRLRQCYLPIDLPFAVARFFATTRPALGVVLETEWWPNLLAEAGRAKVPVALVNARLSERSYRGYLRVRALMTPTLQSFCTIGAQSRDSAKRLKALGATNLFVTGNIKFDLALPLDLAQRAEELKQSIACARPLWIAGSTREGEEALVFDALVDHPLRHQAQALIVPRHPQRFDAIAQLAQSKGFRVARRSQLSADRTARDAEVLIGDSMGEMLVYYALAEVAVMGGTLGNTGGQNLIEPAAVGTPVVLGPSTYNFADAAAAALACGAAREAADSKAALDLVAYWMHHPTERQAAQEAALEFTAKNRGATHRTLALLHTPTTPTS